MFRIGFKFPCHGLNRVKKHGYSRFCVTAKYYETRAGFNSNPERRLFGDIKITSKFSGQRFSTDSEKSTKSRGTGILVTLGTVTIGTVGVLALVKSNPEFRATLEEWIPGTNKTIQMIFQENNNYLELLQSFLDSLKHKISNTLYMEQEKEPKSAFTSLVDKKEESGNKSYTETQVNKEKEENIQVVSEKPAPTSKKLSEELLPTNLVELETYCNQTAAKAVAAYQKAARAIRDYNQDIVKVVENDSATTPAHIWKNLKETIEKRKEALQQTEKHANEIVDSLKQMYYLIDESRFDAPAHKKTTVRRNIKKLLDDVDESKRRFEEEAQKGNVTEQFWKQVKEARECFNEELQILFPDINLNEKKLKISEESFDLFILHMYNKVVHLQKELTRLQTVLSSKVQEALKSVSEDATQEKVDTLISLEVDKQKRIIEEDFSKKLLEERKKFDDEMRRQLKLQSQIHADHLREALLVKEKEMTRLMERALNEQAEAESIKYKKQQAPIVGRLRGLEAALKARLEEEKGASEAQLLWSACMALARAVRTTSQNSLTSTVRPLEAEITAVSKAAPKEDPLVRAAIDGIPAEASKRGVYPEDALREKFLEVEKRARRLAMVPEQGASLPIHFLSYLQSTLIINTDIPKSELQDGPVDINSLNTYDILQRARYWMDRGNFKMTLRYMNLLKGAPRNVAKEWMNETRILLETQQAIDTLLAYAGATGLAFLRTADSQNVHVH